jgi:Fic family protein
VSAALDPDERDTNARSVLGHVDALRAAIRIGESVAPFQTADILEIHRALFERAPEPWSRMAGRVRDGLVWVGSPTSTPVTAEFVGPPAAMVPHLLEDLVAFMNRTDVPALMQAAVAHAQFETIHPFPDGNGRVGRCVIHALLARSGLANVLVPVSSVFAAEPRGYVRGLTEYRQGELGLWVERFTDAVAIATGIVARIEADLGTLIADWRGRLAGTRSDAADWRLIDALLAQPVLNVAAATDVADVSFNAAEAALERLATCGVVTTVGGRRHREWAATEVIAIMSDADARLRASRG